MMPIELRRDYTATNGERCEGEVVVLWRRDYDALVAGSGEAERGLSASQPPEKADAMGRAVAGDASPPATLASEIKRALMVCAIAPIPPDDVDALAAELIRRGGVPEQGLREPVNTFAPHDPAHTEITKDGRCVACMVSELTRLDGEVERLRAALERPRPAPDRGFFQLKAEDYLADRTVWPLGAAQKIRPAVEGFAIWLDTLGAALPPQTGNPAPELPDADDAYTGKPMIGQLLREATEYDRAEYEIVPHSLGEDLVRRLADALRGNL